VSTLDQALKSVRRQDEGSWRPSPSSVPKVMPGVWSSPVPRVPQAAVSIDDHESAMEMIIQDMDPDCGPLKKMMIGGSGGLIAQTLRSTSKFEVEQLLSSPGSLPMPMLPDAREAAMRSFPRTNTSEMMGRLPKEILAARGKDAQELRRKLLRGSTLVFFSAGYPGKRFIFERAAELGVKSVIIDHPDSWSKELVKQGIVAKFLPVDMSQSSEEVFNQALGLIQQLGEDGITGAIDGICTFVELSVPLAARLCEALGLPGLRPAAVDAARDKHATRAIMKAAGLPTPKNMLITNESQLHVAASHVGFPSVLKPVSGAASLGVKKVMNMQEMTACYREVVAELSSLVVSSGALVKRQDNVGGVDAGSMVDLTVLLEQYLDGKEVDIDIVLSDGQWQYAAVSDNGPTLEPYFNETWGLCPSMIPKEDQTQLKKLAVDSCQALGFTSGIFHVECKLTSTGPQLIEVNARMGGGPVRECNRLVWGVDLVEETLFCALGIPARPDVPPLPQTCISYAFVNAPKTGTIKSTKCLEELKNKPGVLSVDLMVAVGSQVVSKADGLPTWLALLVVSKGTSKQALEYIQSLEAGLDLDIQ